MECTSKENHKDVKWTMILSVALCLLLLGGCKQMSLQTDKERNLTIKNIAYDVNKKLGYTIYLRENEQYVPYLVLTNDYGGNVLLLRKHLLDETETYNGQTATPSYYEDSEIDKFLNNVFSETLSKILPQTP